MLRLAIALIVVCGIGVAGCQSASSPDDSGALIGNGPVIPLVHEVFTGFGEPARLVVRDSEQWAEVWARAFAGRSEVPQRSAIDFSKEMVLVAAQGGQGSGGYDIAIDRVATRNGALAVDVTSSSPDQRCGTLAVVTSPVVMVRVQRSTSQVQFVEHARVIRCE